MTEPSSPNEPDSRELALLVGTMFGVALLVGLDDVFFTSGARTEHVFSLRERNPND